MRVIVTGGAGFIGSALVRYLVLDKGYDVLNIDALTYAGNLASLNEVEDRPNYRFVKADICDRDEMERHFAEFAPVRVMHLAAESHVDRSITGADEFIRTNVLGTFTLLEVARHYWSSLTNGLKQAFRFLHVSTDEVYGSWGPTDSFPKRHLTTRARLIRLRKPHRITSQRRGIALTACRSWYRTVPTITGRTISRKS
jgi:dTDP-glucose 4,6-dehydratase